MADALKKVPVREQDPKVRATNFEEVCLGYNKDEAVEEAQRCLGCKNAKCVEGCPVSISIPDFIANVKEGKFEEAYKVSANLRRFLQYVVVSARRKASAKESAYAVLRASLFLSVSLSVL